MQVLHCTLVHGTYTTPICELCAVQCLHCAVLHCVQWICYKGPVQLIHVCLCVWALPNVEVGLKLDASKKRKKNATPATGLTFLF